MKSTIFGTLNRNRQLAISSAETGNSVILFDTIVDSQSVLEIYGVDWGCAVLAAADQTSFLFSYVVGILDFPFDPNNLLVSTAGPDDTVGDNMFWIGNHKPTMQYDDFAIPLIIPPSRRFSVYTVQPLFSAAQAGSVILSLTVRGEYKPKNRQTETIGGLTLR